MRVAGRPAARHRAAAAAVSRLRAMTAKSIDWSQVLYPGRKQPFTAQEMESAGNDAPSATLVMVTAATLASFVFAVLLLAPDGQRAPVVLMLLALSAVGAIAAQWLWWRPWRRPLMLASLGVAALYVVVAVLLRWWFPERQSRGAAVQFFGASGGILPLALWFLVVWRAQQIESRLNQQAERDRAIEMARRLAAAQVEPHFLFNTLASLQHWVQTQDPRAATLLESLTGYLRATLPMFSRPLQPAADELHAVRMYLQVMQARLGARLAWHEDVDPALLTQPLPPGLLLTLVENAIEHGISPQLAGGRLHLRGQVQGGDAVFEVQDNGPGPAPGSRDGIGLANSRERLALSCGPKARLDISVHPEGGCLARLQLPRNT